MTDRLLAPPTVLFKGRAWPSDEIAALAAAWHARLAAELGTPPRPVAIALVNRPEAVALFFACSALPGPLVILGEDPRGWRSAPSIPAGTPLALLPTQRELAGPAEALGLRPHVLEEAPGAAGAAPAFFSFAGTILFTSGSTGPPKPVFRSTPRIRKLIAAMASSPPVSRGAGIIGALPLSGNHGLATTLMVATGVGGRLALLERFDHRSVLALFATRAYECFSCTPLMADLLGRCAIAGEAPPAPPNVRVSAGFLGPAAFRAFRARFGVAPRQSYGSTEGAMISADTRLDEPTDGSHVGWTPPGVEVRIGDHPERPAPRGTPGRVWYVSPWHMDGYGFPPALEPTPTVGGWNPTSDLGVLDEGGRLTLLGRMDERFKTAGGYLVNPEEIAAVLRRHAGVVDAAVVPLAATGAGGGIGALVVSDGPLDAEALRAHAARLLPAWAQPQSMASAAVLPLLPSGKVDRDACVAILTESRPASASR